MSEKLDKLRASLEKERERRIKINNRIESLERRIQEAEAAEVNEMVRTAKVTPEQLAALLRQSATSTPTPAALSAVGATFNKEESNNEDLWTPFWWFNAGATDKTMLLTEEYLHGLQRQRSQGRSVDEVLKHILSAKGHLQAADVPCYILKITIYRSDDTMVDKFSQVAGNVPVTNNDPNRRYTVINGYPVVLNFAKEPNPGVFERVRDILLATSYTKKTS